MTLINKYDPKLPIYANSNFVGYSLTGFVVVSLIDESFALSEPQYRGISGEVIAVNYGTKKPVVLAFNPIYMYLLFLLIVAYAITIRYGKLK